MESSGKLPADCAEAAAARRLEDVFIRGFESAVRALDRIIDPRSGRRLPVRAGARAPAVADEYLRVVEVMKEHRRFDRELFETLPLNRSVRFEVRGGFLPWISRGAPVIIAAASISPIDDLVRGVVPPRRAGEADAHRAAEKLLSDPAAFGFIGLHATAGWETDLLERRPEMLRAGRRRLALVEFDDAAGWRVRGDFAPENPGLERIFDPESPQAKVERCAGRILKHEALRLRGGFVELDDLETELGAGRAAVEKAVEKVLAADPRLRVVSVKGRKLLRRERID